MGIFIAESRSEVGLKSICNSALSRMGYKSAHYIIRNEVNEHSNVGMNRNMYI